MSRSTLLYLIAAGIVAYLYGFPTNGLSHFDEGQYAFARVWPWIDKFDVDQAFFSPPLYPFLVGLVQHFPISRPDLAGVYISWAACWASLYFGVKLAVAWWGRSAALPAFVLLLFSPMRLAFGTIGLTDALFSMLILATLLASTKAFHDGSTKWTILTGLLAGSTWNCKYNGFITLAIIAGFFLHQRTARSFVRWLVICVIAAAMIVPWFWAVHTHHPEGIAALQKHQQGYLRGLTAASVAEDLVLLFNLRSDVPGPSVFIACWVLLGAALYSRRPSVGLIALSFLLAAEECTASRLFPILAIVALPISLVYASPLVRAPIALGVVLTTILPGIYTPYLRLWLPAEYVLLLVIAGAVASADRISMTVQANRILAVVVGLVLLVPSTIKVYVPLSNVLPSRLPEAVWQAHLWLDNARRPVRTIEGYRLAAENLIDRANAQNVERLLVYGRPPLLYYFAHGKLRAPAQRLPDERLQLEQFSPESMLVADIAVRDSRRMTDSINEGRQKRILQRMDGWWVTPHPVTMLDDFGRFDYQDVREYKINQYRIASFRGSNP